MKTAAAGSHEMRGRRTKGDYAVHIKIVNDRLLRRIAECGFRSVFEMCRKCGLQPTKIGDLINLKTSPLTRTGAWRHVAVELADALGCSCEDLFSESQRVLPVRASGQHGPMTERALLKLWDLAEQPLRENPIEQLEAEVDEWVKSEVVRRALRTSGLTDRARRMVEAYFGLASESKTMQELSVDFGMPLSAVQRCLNRSLQRLRLDTLVAHRALRQVYQPESSVKVSEQKRARTAQAARSIDRILERTQGASSG